ncbi:MAG: flagellar protein FlaG [candidate division KSB1 bacterium]|nr:flagellar protein FlaG [candidate division KSB1 bacterium]
MKVENAKIVEYANYQLSSAPNREGPDRSNVAKPNIESPEMYRSGLKGVQQRVANPQSGKKESANKTITSETIEKVVQETNRALEQFKNKQISFFVDKKSGKQGVRIIDTETKKVIKQIPPEEMLKLAARIKEQIGALIDETI